MKPVTKDPSLAVFEQYHIRREYDDNANKWWFSVVDILQVLIQQPDFTTARKYWNKLKERLVKEGSEVVTKCHQLKLKALDGKKYKTDVADVETLFRLIQSVPSPKAEPIKLWLSRVGAERVNEMANPSLAIDRVRDHWRQLGRSEKWIQQRMMGQETRNKLTDYWQTHAITQERQYAILTNIIHQEWSGLSVKAHKHIKSLKNQNLRDHMSEAELIFTALAELSTRQIAEVKHAAGMDENTVAGKQGGRIAKNARVELESKTGKKVVTGENYLEPALQQNQLTQRSSMKDKS